MNQVTVNSVDFLHTAVPSVTTGLQRVSYYWQLDPQWKRVRLPNAIQYPGDLPITIGNYGCLLTCIATLFQIEPDDLALANPFCFDIHGNMNTATLLHNLGSTITLHDLKEGMPLVNPDKACIARTSFYADRSRSGLDYAFPTHFYILLPSGQIVDPLVQNNPQLNNKYKMYTNQLRFITNIKI